MQELVAVLTFVAIILAAGYLVWMVESRRCPECGKRISKREVDFFGRCLPCYEKDAWDEPGVRTCRVCGCTDLLACSGGCYWVEEDLCSRCAPSQGEVGENA